MMINCVRADDVFFFNLSFRWRSVLLVEETGEND